MRRTLVVAGAWAGATVLAAAVAWAAVGIVGSQVATDVDDTFSAAEVAEIAAARTTLAPATVAPTTSAPTTTSVPAATSTSASSDTTSPGITAVTTTSTTTAAPTTTSTAPATGEETRAISVTGGTIVIRWSPEGGARLTSATPAQGWFVEIEKAGPPSVEVKFESGETESEVRIEVSGGELQIRTED